MKVAFFVCGFTVTLASRSPWTRMGCSRGAVVQTAATSRLMSAVL